MTNFILFFLITHLPLLWAATGTLPAIVKKINLQKQGFGEAACLESLGAHTQMLTQSSRKRDSKVYEEQVHQGDEELFVAPECNWWR